ATDGDRRFVGAQRTDGNWMIPLAELQRHGFLDGENKPKRGRPRKAGGLGDGTTGNVIWILAQVGEFARNLGLAVVGNPTANMTGKKKRNKPRAERETVSLAATRAIAKHLHVVHQAVLW